MCGIIGCVGRGGATLETIVHGLDKLEYRGYDSAGVALGNGERLQVQKRAGEIDDLRAALTTIEIGGSYGLGHTRWSTHGPPTDENAHPHVDCTGEVAVVHNGIIENYQPLRDELLSAGHGFTSDTDTEVVPHLIEDALADGADPEIGVAATKTFASQLAALNLLHVALARSGTAREVVPALRDLPADVQSLLDESAARAVAETYVDSNAFFFIGRGNHYPVALEGALKMKEISYRHAEGFAAGELKHGPLALVTEQTPVFAVVTRDDELSTKTVGIVKEVEARNAPVVAVTDGQCDVGRYADHVLEVSEMHPSAASVLANVQLQLVSYYLARELGRSIDKPRNLAKSATLE